MQKRALLALLLVLSLVLSGCALVKKDMDVDNATEIIRLGDQVVTKGEIKSEIDYQLNYMSYIHSMYGMSYDPTSAENIADTTESVISNFKDTLVSKAKITELGLDQLTEEEEAQVKTDAETAFQENLDYLISTNYADSELTEEEIKAKATEELEGMGYTMDSALDDARSTLTSKKLREYIIKDVAVTEEEVKAEYDTLVEDAKTEYGENPSGYCTDVNGGTTVYYTPAGVRMVKQILIQYDDEHKTAITDAQAKVTAAQAILDTAEPTAEEKTQAQEAVEAARAILDKADATEEEKTQAQADLDAAQTILDKAESLPAEKAQAEEDLTAAKAEVASATAAAYASIDAEADEVIASLEGGADWDTLMAEKTDDPGMKEGRATAETGYAVCEGMTNFDSAFVEAAMALQNVGDVSAKTKGSSNGYYIIKYVADAAEGAADYESVKADIEADVLSEKQDDAYNDTLEGWVNAADFKTDLNALNN